jgi:fucose permease
VIANAAAPRLRREVAISHLAGILAGAGATMLGPILPALFRIWAVDDAQAGTLLACEFVGGFCGAIASGWWSVRRSLMTLLAAGLALLALGLAGSALMMKPWMPLFLFVCGLGLGFINPAANLLVARTSRTPAAALNLFAFFWAAGALATPSAIAILLRREAISWVFLELAVPAAVVAVLAAAWRSSAGNSPRESGTPTGGDERLSEHGWFIVITGALLFLYVGVETSVSAWLPTGAARWAAASAPLAAAAQSLFWGALLTGRLLAPVWLRYLAPRTLILAGLVCGAGGVALFLAASGAGILFLGALLAGLGLAPVNPTIVAAFTTRLGSLAARWTGPVFAASGLGGAAIPWLVGAVSSHFSSLRIGFAAPLLGLVCMFLLELTWGSRRIDIPQARG